MESAFIVRTHSSPLFLAICIIRFIPSGIPRFSFAYMYSQFLYSQIFSLSNAEYSCGLLSQTIILSTWFSNPAKHSNNLGKSELYNTIPAKTFAIIPSYCSFMILSIFLLSPHTALESYGLSGNAPYFNFIA